MKQNHSFICEICGKQDLVVSHICIEANYGSANDGLRLMLDVCGDCIDKMFSGIINKATDK